MVDRLAEANAIADVNVFEFMVDEDVIDKSAGEREIVHNAAFT